MGDFLLLLVNNVENIVEKQSKWGVQLHDFIGPKYTMLTTDWFSSLNRNLSSDLSPRERFEFLAEASVHPNGNPLHSY